MNWNMKKIKNGISLNSIRRIFKKLKFVETFDDKFFYFKLNEFVIVLKRTNGNKYLTENHLRVIRFHFEMRGFSNKIIKYFDTTSHIHHIKETSY